MELETLFRSERTFVALGDHTTTHTDTHTHLVPFQRVSLLIGIQQRRDVITAFAAAEVEQKGV